jgi:hypothetical protein
MVPARIFGGEHDFYQLIPMEPRRTYFIARISAGSFFFKQLIFKKVVNALDSPWK